MIHKITEKVVNNISDRVIDNLKLNERHILFNGKFLMINTSFGWHCFPSDQVNHAISYLNSEFDSGMKHWISNNCLRNTTYIDIGANAGTLCGIASRKIIDGKIYAIEPLCNLEDCIRMNVQVNNPLVEFHHHACAIGLEQLNTSFEVFQFDNRVSTSVAYNNNNLADRTEIIEVTVKNINDLSIDPTEHVIIKIDAEGAERNILEEIYKFTQIHKNISYKICFEYAPTHLERAGETFSDIYAIINQKFAVDAYFVNELSGAEHPLFNPSTSHLSGNVAFEYVS